MLNTLINIVGEGNVLVEESMSKHTTFRTGGNAKYFVTAQSQKALVELLKFCKENQRKYYILGNGSNLLVRDEGYDGIMIRLGEEFQEVKLMDSSEGEFYYLQAGAGVILANVSKVAVAESLTGLEFAFGIPGSVGGAMVMNAGAYGGEMKQVVSKVTILKDDMSVQEYTAEEMAFGYRDSILKHQGGIVLSATFCLAKGDKGTIQATMDDLTKQRREKQPLEYPSAGSTFKRPEGYFAGKLIQDAGLKGYRVGGAMVSEKHAGFVINYDKATATDIITLMEDVSRMVKEQSGVTLEPEVIIL